MIYCIGMCRGDGGEVAKDHIDFIYIVNLEFMAKMTYEKLEVEYKRLLSNYKSLTETVNKMKRKPNGELKYGYKLKMSMELILKLCGDRGVRPLGVNGQGILDMINTEYESGGGTSVIGVIGGDGKGTRGHKFDGDVSQFSDGVNLGD